MGNIPSLLKTAFPPPSPLLPTSLPDLTSHIYIITGGTSGSGLALASILFSKNATVYILARSHDRFTLACAQIRTQHPSSKGTLSFLYLDLNDLSTIRPAVEQFLSREDRLDVLFNNAGVMCPPRGSRTEQGLDMMMGVNVVGHFLLTELLTGVLVETAGREGVERGGGVRVVWVSSVAPEVVLRRGGFDVEGVGRPDGRGGRVGRYAESKLGSILLARDYARLHKGDGVVSVVSRNLV